MIIIPSGSLASLHIKKEAVFKTDPTVGTAVIGHGAKITSLERNNNIERIWGLGSRAQQVSMEKQFAGTFGTEHILSNPWIFVCTLGTGSTTGSGPYTHTISESTIVPSYAFKNSIELGATDAQVLLLGCVNNSMTISTSVNEPVMITMDWLHATETFSTPSFTTQTAETFDVFSFAHGSLEFPIGTVIANVQSCEATITNNTDIIWGLGSRTGSAKVEKNREYGITASIYLTDPSKIWRYIYDGTSSGTTPAAMAETATLRLKFTNGLSGISERTIQMDYTNVKIDTESLPQEATAVIMEDVTMIPRGLSITSINNTSAIPADFL